MKKKYLGIAFAALIAGSGCITSTSGDNNEENNVEPNNENNPPSAECQTGDVGGDFDGAIEGDITFCGTVNVLDEIYNSGTARITIRPGTRFILGVDKSVEFGWAGNEATVIAQGTAANPIIFEGSAPNAGHWEEITINNTVTSDSVFEHVIVRHAGSDRAAIVNNNERSLLFKDVTVELSASAGIASKSFKSGSANLNVKDSAGPVAILDHALAVTNFPLGGTYENVDDMRVAVEFDAITDSITFPNPGMPYHNLNGLYNSADVEVAFDAGVEMQFAVDTQVEFGWAGNEMTLNINGTEESPVVFKGSTEEPGHWHGVRVNGAVTTDSTISNLEIWHGGAGDRYPARIQAAITVDGLTFAESGLPALYLDTQGLRDGSANINVNTDTGIAAEIHSSAAHTLPADGSWGSGDAVVELVDGALTASGTLPNLNVPYRVADSLYNSDEIEYEIETGTKLIFASDTYFELGWAGNSITFSADGIEMSGQAGNPGDWQGLRWNNTVSSASFLRNSTITDAGDPALRIRKEGGADITNNTIQNSSGFCISYSGGDTTEYAAENTLDCASGGTTEE